MKFFFTKTDSLYKIFKSLEKIPSHKEVEIFIDPEHNLFDNEWRGQQIKEILEKNHIDAIFTAKNKKNREYFNHIGLKTNSNQEKKITHILNIFYLFFFNIKKFHLQAYETQKYTFILIFIFEIIIILGIIRFIISLIIPSANIVIHPSENSETIIYNIRYYPHNSQSSTIENRFLYVPYYTGHMDYKYDLSISTANMQHITNPSHGEIKIYNKKETEYNLVKNTQFITADGLLFYATKDFIIPAGNKKHPSELIISVKAEEYDQYNQLIGIRGNIPFKTQMRIKNLDESFYAKDIWAESIEQFQGGTSETSGSVSEKDIEILKQKITNQIYEKKMSIVKQNFPISGGFLLPFETITTTKFNDIKINESMNDNTPIINGSAYVSYNYLYVMREDLYKVFITYINERPSENNQLIKIDPDSIQFLKDSDTTNSDEIKKSNDTYIISTQINIVQAYDFANDPKGIISEIKDKIMGLNETDARNLILSSYDEIGSIKISLPLRYDTIPIIKSRIKIGYQ